MKTTLRPRFSARFNIIGGGQDSDILDLNELNAPGRPAFDRDRGLGTAEALGDQSDQLHIGLAIHWRRFQLRLPEPSIAQ